MLNFIRNHKKIIIFVLLFFLVIIQHKKFTGLNYFFYTASHILFPVQKIFYKSLLAIFNVRLYFKSLRDYENDNNSLRNKIFLLKRELIDYNELKLENKKLKEFFKYSAADDFKYIGTNIIGKNPDHWFSSILIDQGINSGIKKYMPVLTNAGLVGSVTFVYPNYSKVRLISDNNSNVGIILQKSRTTGVLRGIKNGQASLFYISKGEKIFSDEIIITSGQGGIFPKGIPVGKIKKIISKKDELFYDIDVDLFENLKKIETALILTGKKDDN